MQKYKRWDEASSSEHRMTGRIGSSLYPEKIDNYLFIEKQIIDNQFLIFRNLSVDNRIQIIYSQYRYLQTIAFQCEEELFTLFFDQLENYVKDNLIDKDVENAVETNLQLISLYANLITQYLVGFNHNLERIINESQLKKLAAAIHFQKDTDTIMQFPYKIRIWIDKYQTKLLNEKYNEKRIVTPLFYTEFELSYQFQLLLKTYYGKLSEDIHKRIISFSNYLESKDYPLESLEFMSESLDSILKIEFFLGIIKGKIEKEINALNLKKEKSFSFSERENLLERNKIIQTKLIDKIWKVGYSSYSVDNEELPDLFGNFYQLICQDILDKAFNDKATKLKKYLPQFFTYNILYIESIRLKIDNKKIEYTSLKLFPIVVDLFEISAISIIIFKLFEIEELEKCFFDYWDNAFKKDGQEIKFWSIVLSIYGYFSQPIFGLSTPSYVKEHERKTRLEKYLKECDLVELVEEVDSDRFYLPNKYYKTDCEDVYIKEIINNLRTDGFGFGYEKLSDVFIEYFLRTRVALKDLNIKETNYGSELRRNMDGDSE